MSKVINTVLAVVLGIVLAILVFLAVDDHVLFNAHKTFTFTTFYGQDHSATIKTRVQLHELITDGWTLDGVEGVYLD